MGTPVLGLHVTLDERKLPVLHLLSAVGSIELPAMPEADFDALMKLLERAGVPGATEFTFEGGYNGSQR